MAAGRLATLPRERRHPCSLRIVIRTLTLHRVLRLGLLLIALVMVSTVGSKPAMAKAKTCADQVIADWYDDGRVGKIYPLHCYREAIASLPSDVIDYSNAKEEISRALAFAKQGKPDPGGKGHVTPTTTPVETTVKTTPTKTGTTSVNTSTTQRDPNPLDTSLTDTSPVDTAVATTQTDTSGPSSVPIPLIVLGSLAVVLLAAGSAGYLRRRTTGGDDELPPASSA